MKIKQYVNGQLIYREETPEEIAAREQAQREYESSPEFINFQISELKAKLSESDYKAIKFAEGILNVVEYAPIRAERQALRDEINRLEALLNN